MTSGRHGLLEEAARRWTALARARPDLQPAIDLQRRLLGEMIEALERLDAHVAPPSAADAGALADRLRHGRPALRGGTIDIPVKLLAPTLDRFCRHLSQGGAGAVADHLLETLESGRLNRASLLEASMARNQRAIDMGARQMGLSPDLVWLVGELATAPLAYRLQRRLFERADAQDAVTLRLALEAWDHGYCPACGSWPALIEYVGDTRTLRCSFCAAAWVLSAFRCPYCTAPATAAHAPDPTQPQHGLECCQPCGGYTKALRVQAPAPFPLVAIEDLETLALDHAAIEQGYTRPPLAELGQ
jgi:hypothetical protein